MEGVPAVASARGAYVSPQMLGGNSSEIKRSAGFAHNGFMMFENMTLDKGPPAAVVSTPALPHTPTHTLNVHAAPHCAGRQVFQRITQV